ncbi:hypothetical protein ACMBCN_00505 [Candidatus Liberibacter asiaticus]|nr:hypothetical protein [Candidatus Liberibacter asiaticus]
MLFTGHTKVEPFHQCPTIVIDHQAATSTSFHTSDIFLIFLGTRIHLLLLLLLLLIN